MTSFLRWLRRGRGLARRMAKSRFVYDVAVLAGGAGLAQLITVAFSPIITRLYGPEAFGILGVFTAILAVLAPLSTMTYGVAIAYPPSDGEARALVRGSLCVAACLSLLAAAVLGIFGRTIAQSMGAIEAYPYLMLIPAVLVLIAIEEVLRNWLVRKRAFGILSRASITQSAAVNLAKSGVGLALPTAPALLVLNAIGHLLLSWLLWVPARLTLVTRSGQQQDDVEKATVSPWKVMHAYRDFPLYRAPSNLLTSLYQSAPSFLLALYFGPVPVGFYALARRVLKMPVQVISRASGKALLPRLAEISHREQSLRPYLVKVTAGHALIGFLPFCVMAIFAPQVFRLVFGSEWGMAGQYARWLSLRVFSTFVGTPTLRALPLLGLQRHRLIYEGVVFCLLVGALVVGGGVLESDHLAVALYASVGAAANLAYVGWVLMRRGDVWTSSPPIER